MIQSDVGGTQNAMDKSFAGVKWRFYEESEQGWQISTYPQVEFATPYFAAVKKGLADKKSNYLLLFEVVRAFEAFDIHLEAGR